MSFTDWTIALFNFNLPPLTYVLVALVVAGLVYVAYLDDTAPVVDTGAGELDAVADRRAVVAAVGEHYDANFGVYAGASYRGHGTYWAPATYDDFTDGGSLTYGDIKRLAPNGDTVGNGSMRPVANADDVLTLIGGHHEGVILAEIPSTTHGDYVGSTYGMSNHEYLLAKYPDTFVVSTDAYDSRTLWLPVVGPLVPLQLVHEISGLVDYPVIDEMHLSDMEHELASKYLDEYGTASILDELTILASNYVDSSAILDADGLPLVDDQDYSHSELIQDIDHDDIVAALDAAYGPGTLRGWIDDAISDGPGDAIGFGHNDVDTFRADDVASDIWHARMPELVSAITGLVQFVPVR